MRIRLEEFANGLPQPEAPQEEEAGNLAAYEEGYTAGWEDAVAAQSGSDAERAEEVARHLRALALDRDAARDGLLRALAPLLEEIGTCLLPQTARLALGPAVAEALLPLAEALTDRPIRLRAAPAARPVVEEHLARVGAGSFEVVEDAALTDGQVVIAAGMTEARVDLDSATATLVATMRTFLESQAMERQNAQ